MIYFEMTTKNLFKKNGREPANKLSGTLYIRIGLVIEPEWTNQIRVKALYFENTTDAINSENWIDLIANYNGELIAVPTQQDIDITNQSFAAFENISEQVVADHFIVPELEALTGETLTQKTYNP